MDKDFVLGQDVTDKAIPQDAEAVENAYQAWREEHGQWILSFGRDLYDRYIALIAFKAGWYAHKRQEISKMEKKDMSSESQPSK